VSNRQVLTGVVRPVDAVGRVSGRVQGLEPVGAPGRYEDAVRTLSMSSTHGWTRTQRDMESPGAVPSRLGSERSPLRWLCRVCATRGRRPSTGSNASSGCWRRVPWGAVDCHYDPVADFRWPQRPSAAIDHRVADGNPTRIWELNRFQHLPWLAQAWLFTGHERFAEAQNAAGGNVSGSAPRTTISSESLRSWRRSRCCSLSSDRHRSGWRRSLSRLSTEASRQILPDGSGVEQAVGYQVFTVELLLAVVVLIRSGGD
jgi:hypothetical protein